MCPSCCKNALLCLLSASPSNDLLLCCHVILFSLSPSLIAEKTGSISSLQLFLYSGAINKYNVNNETYFDDRAESWLCIKDLFWPFLCHSTLRSQSVAWHRKGQNWTRIATVLCHKEGEKDLLMELTGLRVFVSDTTLTRPTKTVMAENVPRLPVPLYSPVPLTSRHLVLHRL